MNNIIQLDSPELFFKRLKSQRDIINATAFILVTLHSNRTLEQLLTYLTPDERIEVYEKCKEKLSDEQMELNK